jgi:hypothetical protein
VDLATIEVLIYMRETSDHPCINLVDLAAREVHVNLHERGLSPTLHPCINRVDLAEVLIYVREASVQPSTLV